MEDMERHVSQMQFKLNRLEQYSRKSSVRVYGIEEIQGEKVGERVIEKIISKETDIVHRTGCRYQEKPRGILVKFMSHKSKVNIMQRKENVNRIGMSEDLSYGTRKMLNMIHNKKQEINVEKAWTIDGKIKYKLRNDEAIHKIRSAEDYLSW